MTREAKRTRPRKGEPLSVAAMPPQAKLGLEHPRSLAQAVPRPLDCERPHVVYHGTRKLRFRCRKCEPCRQHRSRQWFARTMREIKAAPGRTWFLTFTFRPHQGEPEGGQGARYKELQKFWKRLRRGVRRKDANDGSRWPPASFRMVSTLERGDEGTKRWHWHALVMEQDPSNPIRKRTFEHAWPQGYMKASLATQVHVRYITKTASYAVKGSVKVHASLRFGKSDERSRESSAGEPSGSAAAATPSPL